MASCNIFITVFLLIVYLAVAHCQNGIMVTSAPADMVVAEGAAARFDCGFTASVPVAITWQRSGIILTPSSKFTFLLNNSLVISPTEPGDDVTYSCILSNQVTGEIIERSASLQFAEFLNTFETTPTSIVVDEGAVASFFCLNTGSLPPANIVWTFNGQPISSSSRIFITSSTLDHIFPPQTSSSLHVTGILPEDQGHYNCVAINTAISGAIATSPSATLTITPTPEAPIIAENPVNVIVSSAGQNATLSCFASGEPPPTYSWSLNNVLVTESSTVIIVSNNSGSSLVLSSVDDDDVGEYSCSAVNSQGTALSNTATVEIAVISNSFELEPSDVVAVIDTSLVLNCLPPSSIPPATIAWSKAFVPITNPRYQVLSNGSLLIPDVIGTDQALYHCTATNPVSMATRTSSPAQLTAIGIPLVTPAAITVEEGGMVTFTCTAEGDPAPQIMWYRGADQITEDTLSRAILTDNTLTISDIRLSDEDYYRCRAVFPQGETSIKAILDVLSAPTFLNPSISITVVAPSPAVLLCDVFPDPSISFSWSFSGQLLPLTDSGRYQLSQNGSLIIADIGSEDSGVYTCIALNDMGRAEGTVSLTVQVPPAISADATAVNVTMGATVTLSCTSSGDPIPDFTWLRNEITLETNGHVIISSDRRSLTLVNVSQEDEGQYMCEATNVVGSESATINLDVQATPKVQVSPPTLEVLAGSTATFLCSVSGDPPPTVNWLNSQSVNVLDSDDPRIQVGSDLSLVITNVQLADSQQYVCEANNVVGSAFDITLLTVLAAPTVFLVSSLTVIQGDLVTLNCNPIGWPTPTVVWTREGSELSLDSRVSVTGEGQLAFSNVVAEDTGTYICTASNDIGVDMASTALTVLVRPAILLTPALITFNQGDTLMVDCEATGIPSPEVSWFQDSVLVPDSDLNRISQTGNSLIIAGVQKGDEGEFICQAMNSAGTDSVTITLAVNVPPTISAVDSSVTVVEGSEGRLSCVATGDPSPVYTWTRNGVEITGTGGQFALESAGVVLVVRSASVEDEGVYQCQASNVAGRATDTVTLNVIVPPAFVPSLVDVSAVEGSSYTLSCQAEGDPTPLVTWSRGSQVLSTNGMLEFDAVTRNDGGIYTCTANNTAGVVSQDVFLDVFYEPVIFQLTDSLSVPVNGVAELSCIVDGNPSPTIVWQLNGSPVTGATASLYQVDPVTAATSGEYSCVATNIVGTASASLTLTALFPPSPPTIVAVTTLSSSSITVEWSAPSSDGGSPLTGFTVEYRPQTSSDLFTTESIGVDATEVVLSGLSPFTTYDVQVRAVNVIGSSQSSQILSTLTHPAAPVAPGNLRITSSTFTSISISWDTPDPLNGNLAAYTLRHGDETQFLSDLTERLLLTTQFEVTNLRGGVVYRVEVRAGTVSILGEILWGPFAIIRVLDGNVIEVVTESPSTPPPTTVPPATTPSTASPSTEQPTTASPSTAPPTTAPPTTAPSTTALSTDTTTESPTTVEPTSTTAPLTSTPSPLNPPIVVPDSVTALVPGVPGQLIIYWREPTSGLDTFIGYQIFLSPLPPPEITIPIFAEKTPISGTRIISGLEHGTTYTATVATYNEDGLGPLTATATATTIEAVPTQPLQVQVSTLSDQAVFISWQPPNPTNGVIIDYSVTVCSEPGGQPIRTLVVNIEIASLDNLELTNLYYSIAISARNGAGLGPESEPVFFGTEPALTTIEPTSESTTSTDGSDSTTQPTSESTTSTDGSDATTQPTSESTTSTGTTASSIGGTNNTTVLDETYYIVRIVPPVVVGVFLIAMLVVTIMFIVHIQNVRERRKKGVYRFSNDTDGQDMQELTLNGEKVVASDDVKTSGIQVKEALDANFSYSPPSKMEEGKDDIDEPDIGTELKEDIESVAPIGRDALEEPASRPDSEEVPTFFPGQGESGRAAQRYATPPHSMFDPSNGLSSGGLLETRIGAVGPAKNTGSANGSQIAAQMY